MEDNENENILDEEEMTELLEKSWSYREEVVYKAFFKNMPEQIITPIDPAGVAIGGVRLVLSCAGVYEIQPSAECSFWTYITSGLSNPLDETVREYSGYGTELLIQTSNKAEWPVYQLFNLMGYMMETAKLFDIGHRIPLNCPINDDSSCELNTILFEYPVNLPA